MFAAALGLIEPDQHGRVRGGGFEQIEPVAGTLLPKHVNLPPHEISVPHLDGAGRKLAMRLSQSKRISWRCLAWSRCVSWIIRRRFSAWARFSSSVLAESFSSLNMRWIFWKRSLRSGSGLAQSGGDAEGSGIFS